MRNILLVLVYDGNALYFRCSKMKIRSFLCKVKVRPAYMGPSMEKLRRSIRRRIIACGGLYGEVMAIHEADSEAAHSIIFDCFEQVHCEDMFRHFGKELVADITQYTCVHFRYTFKQYCESLRLL